MNPLRLLRTSTFQLAWWYMGIFGASALILIGVLRWATVNYLEQQSSVAIEAELAGLTEQYRQRGPQALQSLVNARAAISPGVLTLYLFADEQRQRLAGNLVSFPPLTADASGWYNFSGVDADKRQLRMRGRMVVLRDGKYLLVAQDQSRLESIRALIDRAALWALLGGLALALIGGVLMSSSVMGRIDAINRASRQIMTGRLQSRMPVRGVNDEFDQLSENLNAMLDRIDSLIEGVKSVADNIAHDLRTPLTRLRGRLENLTGRPDLNDELRGELGAAMAEADHLLATFRALLRIARIESGTHDREWAEVNLAPLLEDAWELYQAVGEEKDIVVHLGPASGHLRGDRDLLFQALCNLLDNAIKYSPPGSEVTLAVNETGDSVDISVADHGPGVPAGEREKVLDRFYRSAAVAAVPGSGLGLSLVKAIAHHHGGQLVLTDNAPGLRATLHLPKARGPEPGPASTMAPASGTQ
ncbi:MAG: HAMP domain-containing histidine kinase [Chromatiales bacterium]|nr:HAMP domain-containing histidine kinase [Chromatiales bacterium]